MLKKLIILLSIVILISIILLSGCSIWKDKVESNTVISYQKSNQEINLYFFHRNDCGLCVGTLDFLNNIVSNKYKKFNINIKRFELTENDNLILLYYLLDSLGYKQNTLNIPILIINDTVLIGEKEIKSKIEGFLVTSINSNLNNDHIEKLIIDFRSNSKNNYSVDTNFFSIPAIILSSLIDSINPCAIAIILFLISTLVLSKNKKEVLKYGFIYIITIVITYLSIGLGFIYLIKSINIPHYFYVIVGCILIIIGIISIKDYFWYKQGISLGLPGKIKVLVENNIHKGTIISMILLGIIIAIFEATCSGAIYFGVLSVIAKQGLNFKLFSLVILYNLIFILPLAIILIVFYFGLPMKKINRLIIQKRKELYRLINGIVLILLGLYLILRLYVFSIK